MAPTIGFLNYDDPALGQRWSGICYFMWQALRRHAKVVHIGKTVRQPPLLRGWLERLRGAPRWQEQAGLAEQARAAARAEAWELRRAKVDVLFAPVASVEVAYLDTSLPIVGASDATFRLLSGYYPSYMAMPEAAKAAAEELEQRFVARCDRLIYSSRWAAGSAIDDYGADPATVHLLPMGANLDADPPAEAVLPAPPGQVCRLLFLGVDWQRKGGPIAVETTQRLRAMGIEAELLVCGCTPPPEDAGKPGVIAGGYLDKRLPEGRQKMAQILASSHFMLFPTRAEAFGCVICEASAFALPVLGTDTGGVNGAIEDGVNGFLMPYAAEGAAYAGRIAEVFQDRARYEQLRRAARQRYEQALNWRVWAQGVMDVIAGLRS